tara:strand:- start:55 stop:2091 length:2037 start_codon:yes stop_codon:yes gene_type:complete
MAVIEVEGLGKVQIKGNQPTAEEEKIIYEQLQSLDSEDIGATETVIPEMVFPDLGEDQTKLQGLEYIGGRPTFETIGAIGGGVVGTPAGLPGIVAGGTLGTAGTGQLYDVLQSAITDEPTDFGTQVERAKKDFQREAILQTFFAKIPGMGTAIKRGIFGKPKKELYDSAKRLNYPLSLSDSGNMIARGYGRVIGIFPFVGQPIKKSLGAKSNILNKTADDTLNTFAPNVTLTQLGIDMAEASKSTYGDFRRVTGFLYDDFYNTASKVKEPIIQTVNFKKAINNYLNLIDDGIIKIKGKKLGSPQRDDLYKYARDLKKIDNFINPNQYKRLIKDFQKFSKLSQKEGLDIKVITGLKGALEKDLNMLSKKSYTDYLVKKGIIKDPKLAASIKNKLDFANKVYANGLENSIIVKMGKDKVKLAPTVGVKTFKSPISKKFQMIDKNIFGPGYNVPGSITADQLGNVLMSNRNLTPQLLDDLRGLVGKKQFDRFVRGKIQQGFDKSLIYAKEGDTMGLTFDPYKFEDVLGLNNKQGRELIEAMLKDSKLTIQKLDDFFAIAKNHAGLQIPDVSKFVARRATLGGTKSLFGGFAMGYSTFKEPIKGLGIMYLARKGSGFLANPKQLEDVMTVLDPKAPAYQVKNAALKLVDGLISESKTKQEKNDFYEMKEFIELLPLKEIKEN